MFVVTGGTAVAGVDYIPPASNIVTFAAEPDHGLVRDPDPRQPVLDLEQDHRPDPLQPDRPEREPRHAEHGGPHDHQRQPPDRHQHQRLRPRLAPAGDPDRRHPAVRPHHHLRYPRSRDAHDRSRLAASCPHPADDHRRHHPARFRRSADHRAERRRPLPAARRRSTASRSREGRPSIEGFVINRFSGSGIVVDGPGGNDHRRELSRDGPLRLAGPCRTSRMGIFVNGSSGNTIQNDIVSGNGQVGVLICGPPGSDNLVIGNRIGTNASGTAAVPNGLDGVYLFQAPDNVVTGNTISGNGSVGIQIQGASSIGNIVSENLIGTNATGTAAFPTQRRRLHQPGPEQHDQRQRHLRERGHRDPDFWCVVDRHPRHRQRDQLATGSTASSSIRPRPTRSARGTRFRATARRASRSSARGRPTTRFWAT